MEDGLMQMTRRSFLKSLAAIAGVTAVPALGVSLPSVPEPVSWMIDEFDWGHSFGVGCKWPNGARHAVAMVGKPTEKSIAYCKQALRQWYYERHILGIKKAA